MLRVFKPTSPLSVGSWILASFSGLASVAAASSLSGRLPLLGRLAGVGGAALGPPLATYTAALLCNTAIPAWHEAYREMPFLFAGSASAAAGGLSMLATPTTQAGPARRLAAAGAVVDLVSMELVQRRLGDLAEPYRTGRPGRLLSAARVLTVVGGVGSLVGARSRVLSGGAGLSLAAASLLTRFGVFQAGLASADDPKYVVTPQRKRLAVRKDDRTLAR
jgi:hypothetical protein